MPTAARLPRDRTTRLAVTYRAKASECAELAAKTIDPQSKQTLEKQPSSGRRSLTASKNTKQNLE